MIRTILADTSLIGDIPNTVITNGGAAGILALAVLAVLRGWLVPRKVLEEAREDREARLVDMRQQVDDWKAAFQASEQRATVLAGQVGELLELARATDEFVRSVPRGGRVTR